MGIPVMPVIGVLEQGEGGEQGWVCTGAFLSSTGLTLTDHWSVNRGVQLAVRGAVSSQCGCWPVCVMADVGMSYDSPTKLTTNARCRLPAAS